MKVSSTSIVFAISIVLAGTLIGFLVFNKNKTPSTASSELVQFAQCLTEKKAEFYGAFWCPHCQTQKALFGAAAKYLPYTECSTPDGNSQLPVCNAKGIKSYPTWIFANGEQHVGELSLEELSNKTGCQLISETASTTSTTS